MLLKIPFAKFMYLTEKKQFFFLKCLFHSLNFVLNQIVFSSFFFIKKNVRLKESHLLLIFSGTGKSTLMSTLAYRTSGKY